MDDIFLSQNRAMITKQRIVASKCNKYFINVAQNLLKDLGESKFQDYLKNPDKNIFFLKEIELDKIYKLLQEVNIKKASDIYGISPKVIKVSAEKIKEPLALIFNMSFRGWVFPEKLIYGVVYPILKGESKITCSNYAPISILPIKRKILEKRMHKRLFQYLNKFDILYNYQFGFQKGKSTEHATLNLHTKIIKSTENMKKPVLYFWIRRKPSI